MEDRFHFREQLLRGSRKTTLILLLKQKQLRLTSNRWQQWLHVAPTTRVIVCESFWLGLNTFCLTAHDWHTCVMWVGMVGPFFIVARITNILRQLWSHLLKRLILPTSSPEGSGTQNI